MAQLCAAPLSTSDNTAANLMLSTYGGPAGLTSYARELGDQVARLDRNEPTLNAKNAEQLLDTNSPRAMLRSMHKVVLGDAL